MSETQEQLRDRLAKESQARHDQQSKPPRTVRISKIAIEREKFQAAIVMRYGVDGLDAAIHQLCQVCKKYEPGGCHDHLIPMTLDAGAGCIYFT